MSIEAKKKPRLRTVYALAALALILVVASLSVGVLSYFQSPSYYILSGVKETEVTSVYSSTGNTTRTMIYENPNWTASYEPGKTLTLKESLYTTSETGVTIIRSVVSNTPGFVFESSSISLPALVAYAPSISEASQKVEFTFQTPSAPYNGDFEYTVQYSLTGP